MPLDDFESKVMEFMGTTKEALRNLETGSISQGERIGNLEARFSKHLELRSSNSNGWKTKGVYGGTGAALLGLMELVRHWLSE